MVLKVWTYTTWRRGLRLWTMRSRTLRIIAVLAVVSLFILTLQYIHRPRTPSLIVITRHQDVINVTVKLCTDIKNVNRNLTTYNAGIFTSILQRIVDWTIITTICAHSSVTPWPDSSDIFISVKTTSSNHNSRLPLLLTTWMQTVHAKQIHIVTDTGDDKWTQMANSMGMSTIISDCPASHAKPSLWCKSGVEFEQYYAKRENYRWFCHFDDDTYVNIPVLVKTLQQYNPERERLYLGHMPSRYSGDLEKWKNITVVTNRALQRYFPEHKGNASAPSYYAAGASYCFSSSLMAEMEIYIRGKRFSTTCSRIHHPDDVVLGIITSVLLGYNLTEMPLMQSHIEAIQGLPSEHLKDYISVGYLYNKEPRDIVRRMNISHAQFSTEEDPTRFLSYHCLLFPETSWCRKS